MIKTFYSRATVCIVASLFLFVTSCIQEEYRISEETLNLEVTVFQEGISLPLGSTDSIKVSYLVDQLDPEVKEMFQTTDGAYAFGMTDKFDFSDQLAFLSESFSIGEFFKEEKIAFNLADVDVSGVNVPAKTIPYQQKLSDVIAPVELKIDPIRPEPVSRTTDISSYAPKESDLELGLEGHHYEGVIASLSAVNISQFKNNPLLSPFWNTELPIDDITSKLHMVGLDDFNIDTNDSFAVPESDPIEVSFRIPLPDAITEVKDVHLNEGAKITITVDLTDNLFFTSGDIIPHVDLDVHEIFHLTKEENDKHPLHIDHIEDDFILNHESANPYYASHTYVIQSIELNYNVRGKNDPKENGDFYEEDGHLVLDKTIKVLPKLDLTYKDLMTSLEELSKHTEDTEVKMKIDVEFSDFNVDNVAVVVEPMTTSIETSIDLNISESLGTDLINGVNKVTFGDGSGLNLDIDVNNIDRIAGLDFAIETLELTFPDGIDVEGAVNNKLDIKIGSLTDAGATKHVAVRSIILDPSAQTTGMVNFNGKVDVLASAKASVKNGQALNTKDLPKKAEDNISMAVSAEVVLDVEDFEVDFAGYYYQVSEEETFDFPVPAEVAEMGTVTIVPETVDGGEPVIVIDVVLPDTGLDFGPSEKGLEIDFPDMLVFKELASGLDLQAGNVLKFTDVLPSHIELPIDYIVVDAQKVGEEYKVIDVLKVSGEVGVAAGVVRKADVDALSAPDAMVSFNASIPEMVPSTVNIDRYQASVPEEKIAFGDNINLSSLPEQLVSVGEILLKDVVLDIDVKAPGINELVKDADVNVSMYVTLPDAIMVEEGRVNAEGVLEVTGKLEDEEIVIEPVKIIGLSLDKTAEELSKYMSGLEIRYGGNITVENATLDMNALENADLNLDIDIKLATAGSDKIEIAKVTGKVDYQVDPITMEVELGSLFESLNSENLTSTLDLHRFSLALDLRTNLSVPLLADLSIIPYKNGEVIEGETLSEELTITMPEASSEPSLLRFWISNFEKGQDEYMPEGYEHICLNLMRLISLNPDKIELALNAGTDPDKLASIAPAENGYVLSGDYAFNLPLEFGNNTKIEFRQVIEDLPEELGTILQYGSLALTGEILSSLPLELEMTYNFLDSEGNVVELVENAGKQIIKPGTVGGDAVATDLNIVVGVKKGAELTDIRAVELVFKATGVPAAPIKEDTFVKATLQALIPEGVTIDLNQLGTDEEVEN